MVVRRSTQSTPVCGDHCQPRCWLTGRCRDARLPARKIGLYFFVRLPCEAYATTKTMMKMAAMAPVMR